jgi:hypothetical protein
LLTSFLLPLFIAIYNSLEAAASNGKPAVKASPANAWNRPLKAKPTGPPPGMGPAEKTMAQQKAKATNGAEVNTILRERLLHLSLTLVGNKVVLTQTNGAVLEGIFHTFTPFPNLSAEMKNKYVLSTVRTVKKPISGEHNMKDGSTVIIPVEKVMCLHAKNINLDRSMANGGAPKGDVMTDTQISGSKGDKNREFVAAGGAWTAAGAKSRVDTMAGGLEEKGGMTRKGFGTARPSGLKGSIGEWDQFRANEELFNVQATYDENLYTTELDKSQIDSRKIRAAERIAKEIETTASTNIHIAEERGHVVETDFDEEDRYSGVLTKDGKQRHSAIPAKASDDKSSAPKKMNYAAAAAKADAGKKVGPPGFSAKSSSTADKAAQQAATVTPDGKTEKPKKAASRKEETPAKNKAGKEGKVNEEEKVDDTVKKDDKKEEERKEKPKSKLNANAKSFSFNPSAKTFTPSFGGGSTFSASESQQPQPTAHPGIQQPPPYMHPGSMGQAGKISDIHFQNVCFCREKTYAHSYRFFNIYCRNDTNDESSISGNSPGNVSACHTNARSSTTACTTSCSTVSSTSRRIYWQKLTLSFTSW